jgi:ankyrin repeat protein
LLNFQGIDASISNKDNNTPLHYFCEKFRSPDDCGEVFDLLVKLGANVNSQNKNNEAPIHKAVFNNSIRILLVFPNESVCSGEIRWKLFFNTGQQLIF